MKSKFPDIGETIFTTISLAANKGEDVTNLGQGFPNFDAHPYLLERVCHHTLNQKNQYAPMMGVTQLREQITHSHYKYYETHFDPVEEVTVTSGATEAIFCAISAVVTPGDEVIILDPAYDSYNPNVRMNGGVPVHVNMNIATPDDAFDWQKIKDAITPKTKMIILNTPHNPSGVILKESDLDHLWDLIKDTSIYILSDEVYQHIIFDGHQHVSPLNDERMRERTFAISSFGKSFHVTGWKVGYCIAPAKLTKEFRKIHQYTTFCTFAGFQYALAETMEREPYYFSELSSFYQQKRDHFQSLLAKTSFKILPCSGSYFQLVDYSAYSDKNDFDYCLELIQTHKLAAIPLSALYARPPEQKLIRLCFAKTQETLEKSMDYFK
ncbi:MAG: methionine aminotransferase [Halobacteriovoraceae bacterium]|nr:methionine aminotransferase [Halobacteriovoraceae bacterium]|tara:strand:- start:1838 stop:2980 length:1143 start_codon:yes stop_codon:yes gene_type:complete